MDAIELDPHEGIRVTAMLADAANIADGKLNMLGAGWSFVGPEPATFVLAGQFHIPWAQTNRPHQFRFELVDLDGQPVEIPAQDGEVALAADGQVEAGRPPGVRTGSTMAVPFIVPFAQVPLPPGMALEWRLSVNDRPHPDGRLPLTTRPNDGEPEQAP